MTPYKHQVEIAQDAYSRLQDYGLVYLALEERTGKTLTAILVAEESKAQHILVVTKKNALPGWQEHLGSYPVAKQYELINYHSLHKIKRHFDLVILDEAHNYVSSFPKPSKTWKTVRKFTTNKPIIYLSATPYAQGPAWLFPQLALSDRSPWRSYKSYYEWFSHYGVPKSLWINMREVKQYTSVKDNEVLADCNHLFITKTRQELGFEFEPRDELHTVSLSAETKSLINRINSDRVCDMDGLRLVCDSIMKLRTALHMIEGGVAKIDDKYLILDNTEKIQYIKETWGDSSEMAIMHNYVAEETKLKAHFQNAAILQATRYAEGVDLSHFKHLIIYSQDFSTARHTQRRARQANKKRAEEITVHYLLVKGGISEQVYEAVSVNKQNYVDSLYQGVNL